MTKRADTAEGTVAQLTLANSVLDVQHKDLRARVDVAEKGRVAQETAVVDLQEKGRKVEASLGVAVAKEKMSTARIEELEQEASSHAKDTRERLDALKKSLEEKRLSQTQDLRETYNAKATACDVAVNDLEKAQYQQEEIKRQSDSAAVAAKQEMEKLTRHINELHAQLNDEKHNTSESVQEVERLRQALATVQEEHGDTTRAHATEAFDKGRAETALKHEVEDLQTLLAHTKEEAVNANGLASEVSFLIQICRDCILKMTSFKTRFRFTILVCFVCCSSTLTLCSRIVS